MFDSPTACMPFTQVVKLSLADHAANLEIQQLTLRECELLTNRNQ